MKYWILALCWINYCVLHSGLITNSVTSFFKQRLGINYKYYRISYNIFAIVTLIPIVFYTYSIKQTPFFCWAGYFLPVRYLLLAMGLLILYTGSRHYDMQTFLGLKQIKLGVNHNLINTSGKIDSTGILGIFRHPFYSGSILILWANNLDYSILIVNIILSIYLIIGTFLEEQKLVREFGNEYREYQKKVSMLFPIKWIFKRVRFLKPA
ncbi:MAG: NnrU family protein [Bacteroidales bacterium]|nr:NnrU family protein [Bacteroidales bacterium]